MATSDIEKMPAVVQMIDRDGYFRKDEVERLLVNCGSRKYQVVAIMGPQSSGKSTLLNQMFQTDFKVMDGSIAPAQTTQGVWLQIAPGLEPCTLVMDLEGADGQERGPEDTAFEKRTALLAMSVANTILINMFCRDVGLENAGSKPLLRNMFQMMWKFVVPKKQTLVFILRDGTHTPKDLIKELVITNLKTMWKEVKKPPEYIDSPFEDFFNVDVEIFTNFQYNLEGFKQEVEDFQMRTFNSSGSSIKEDDQTGHGSSDQRDKMKSTSQWLWSKNKVSERRDAGQGADSFPVSTKMLWAKILKDDNLDLPAHDILMAKYKCGMYAEESYHALLKDVSWKELMDARQSNSFVQHFGQKMSAVLRQHVGTYDSKTTYFNEGERIGCRESMMGKITPSVKAVYDAGLEQFCQESLKSFEECLRDPEFHFSTCSVISSTKLREFDIKCQDHLAVDQMPSLNPTEVETKLKVMMADLARRVKFEKREQAISFAEQALRGELEGPVDKLLEDSPSDTWRIVRNLVKQSTKKQKVILSKALERLCLSGDESSIEPQDLLSEFAETILTPLVNKSDADLKKCMKTRLQHVFDKDCRYVFERELGTWLLDSVVRLLVAHVAIRIHFDSAKEDEKIKHLLELLLKGGDTGVDHGINGSRTQAAVRPGRRWLFWPPRSSDHTDDLKAALSENCWCDVEDLKSIVPAITYLTPDKCEQLWRDFRRKVDDNLRKRFDPVTARLVKKCIVRSGAAVSDFVSSIFFEGKGKGKGKWSWSWSS